MNYSVITINNERHSNVQKIDDILSNSFEKINLEYIDGKNDISLNDFFVKNPDIKLSRGNFTKGQIGCFASHFLIWKHIVENNLKNTIIFEDDAIIYDYFIKDYNNAIDNVPEDWDILTLFVPFDQIGTYYNKDITINEYICQCYQNWSTLCYSVSLNGAKKLYDTALKHGMDSPVDWFMFFRGKRKFFNIYSLPPTKPFPVGIDTNYKSQVK